MTCSIFISLTGSYRLLVFDAVERLEIAFRTQVIYHPSLIGGAFWFEDESNFYDIDRLNDHLLKLDEEVRRSGEVFIDQFNRKYTGESTPPVWMAFEVISLGLLSKFYQNLKISSPAKKTSPGTSASIRRMCCKAGCEA